VDQRREVFVYPKARNLTFRSLEILRRQGLGSAVDAVAEHTSHMVIKPSLNSDEQKSVVDADFFPARKEIATNWAMTVKCQREAFVDQPAEDQAGLL
jgi:hypothetical protein